MGCSATCCGICIGGTRNYFDAGTEHFLLKGEISALHRISELNNKTETHVDALEQVLAPGETSHEQQGVNPLINLLGLFLDEVQDLLNDGVEDFATEEVTWDSEFSVDESNGGVVYKGQEKYSLS